MLHTLQVISLQSMWATAQNQVVMTAQADDNTHYCSDSLVSRCLLASDFVNESLVGNYEGGTL